MPKQRQVAIAAGAGYTDILCSTICHYLRVEENDDTPTETFNYKLPGDTTVYKSAAGVAITRLGHGRSGLLGKPPNYNADGVPATGDVLISLSTVSLTGCNVKVYESENEL